MKPRSSIRPRPRAAPPLADINVNVLNREMLMDAMEHPDKYPNLVSGVQKHSLKGPGWFC
jgi:autonomous glycyl radical cofactor GrcA